MNEIKLPPLADANGNLLPNVLTRAGLLFERQGSGLYLPRWQEGTGGAAHVRLTSSDVAHPSQRYLTWSGAVGAADNAVLYTSVDVSGYNYHAIENRSAVPVDVLITVDGTFNASQPSAAVLLTDDVTTGGGVLSITIPANKTGILNGKFMNIRVQQVGAGSITINTVVGAHGVV